ncbi:MAG: GNAT family N-acetyltransferase [bacterium]
MNKRVSIRRLRKGDDLGEMVDLSRAFFEEYQKHHEEIFRIGALRDCDIIGYFSRFVGKREHAAFVAVVGGRIVGYITVCVEREPGYWAVARMGHISGLMVRREERRGGIGTGLLGAARAYFRDQGVKYYTVYTAVKNRAGVQFYRGCGLKPLHTHLVGEL